MKKNVGKELLAVLGAAVLLVVTGCDGRPAVQDAQAVAVEDAIAEQRFCPVMTDMAVNRDLYVDHDGKRVYFCCPGCIPTFQADPEKYMEQLEAIHADPARAVPAGEAQGHDHEHPHH